MTSLDQTLEIISTQLEVELKKRIMFTHKTAENLFGRSDFFSELAMSEVLDHMVNTNRAMRKYPNGVEKESATTDQTYYIHPDFAYLRS